MEDDDETFEDYVETTVPIGQALPLLATGIISILLFVPVIKLSFRRPKELKETDDDVFDHENGATTSSPSKSSLAESAPLLSSASSGYGGTDVSPTKSVLESAPWEDFEDDEAGKLVALRFSDPNTSAVEKFKIVALQNCDAQTQSMLGVGFPFLLQALVGSVSEFIQMSVVGNVLGIDALTAWVVMDLFIKVTTNAVGEVIISGNTMISQIAEAEDPKVGLKIGSYLQFSIIIYVIAMIPIMIIWSFYTEGILAFLGIDPDMAEEGQRFARAYVITILVDGINSAFQYTLDVVGFQVQSTMMAFVGEVFTTSSILLVMYNNTIFPEASLTVMGWTYVFADICYLAFMMVLFYYKGWFEPYYEGLFSNPLSVFRNRTAQNGSSYNKSGATWTSLKLMISNTIQYACSNFLFEAEWQILVFFASFLGAAEVAAWGVLGVIWESLEEIVNAISEGCEVRVANTLGKGDAKTAKLITYKAIWISLIWGVLVSIVFLLFEDEIPRLITTDPVLREMVSFNLPMISLANIVSGIAIMAEHVLWCQNRAKLATIIASATSLLVTLPLAGLSSFVFDFNLIGQTAGVAIGAAAFAAWSMHAVISSDWKQISEDVMAIHADEDESDEESSDDEDEELSSASEEEGEEEE